MTQIQMKGPHNRGKCPFYVIPQDPLSATSSIQHCINCVKGNRTQLESLTEDLQQIALLTILEETPKYDPDHPSGASYTTFIKARVCTRLWAEQKKALQSIPYSHQETLMDPDTENHNPLMEMLAAQACTIENVADAVIQKIETACLRKYLPELLEELTQKERSIIEMKFFQEFSGVEIAEILKISEGRVSQLTKSALEKLGKAYLSVLDKAKGNPYSHTN